ncbi:membrane protein DedA with SNARE-associated domain [Paenibacillus forsythiae]|uniref:Membrane protein DedA with SNARE-associated domain n=1 Tax=Paenibacillus forsythiae TaxID=365616 RepID=A0ABU3H9B6_9BACL|nr:DedA family protein [Paenibacillus forsythiae]MDT3427422.1 membrane protein DedA with SNARE-associated domain [Paenibacillus forsythiae]
MKAWITDFMEQFGYVGIFLLLALENVFPPIPSEVILPFGGFMTTTSDMTISGVILAATLGSVLGAVILYGIGRTLAVDKLERLVDKYGRIVRIRKEDIRKADVWFDKYGYWTVLFCRMIPLIRSLISVPAGMSGMKLGPFLLLTALGSLGWNVLLVMVGAALGESWHEIGSFMDVYSGVIYVLLAGGALFLGWLYVRKRKLNESK